MNRGFELVARPNPIDLALLGFTGGFAAAAHWRDVRRVEQVALDASVAYGRIHGHNPTPTYWLPVK